MTKDFSPGNELIDLLAEGTWPESRHQFDSRSEWAVRAALAAQRPLLIRGEPGIGKSQLARAAAAVLKVPFLSQVVHERCEVGDLLYTVDAVSRLAHAQLAAAAGQASEKALADMAEERFIKPGVLWWALDWVGAAKQAKRFFRDVTPPAMRPEGWKPAAGGCVLLIDEIDKADQAVPNALLETLGNLGFPVPEIGLTVKRDPHAAPPLVIITTNEERELPAAFLRRCFVLHLAFPSEPSAATAFLLRRARIHFTPEQVPPEVCDRAAEQLLADRAAAPEHGLARPGAAEYLDLLRALHELHPGDGPEQLKALEQIKDFALCKNPAEEPL